MKIRYITEKAVRRLRREIIRHSSNPRPASYPFISGDGFRALAQHIFESENDTLDAQNIQKNDIVFVQSDMLVPFFKNIHPHITNPYILITHNSDTHITESETRFIDEKIIHWFAQNALVEHPKITPIPIGLENAHFANAGLVTLYKPLHTKEKRNGRILVAFSPSTNRVVREKALEELKQNPLADIFEKKMTQREYVELLRSYSYVASPPGNGIDCIRTWEAIAVKTVPICLDNTNSRYFKNLGAPIKIVDDFKKPVSEDEYLTILSDSDPQITSFDYWKTLIQSKIQP